MSEDAIKYIKNDKIDGGFLNVGQVIWSVKEPICSRVMHSIREHYWVRKHKKEVM